MLNYKVNDVIIKQLDDETMKVKSVFLTFKKFVAFSKNKKAVITIWISPKLVILSDKKQQPTIFFYLKENRQMVSDSDYKKFFEILFMKPQKAKLLLRKLGGAKQLNVDKTALFQILYIALSAVISLLTMFILLRTIFQGTKIEIEQQAAIREANKVEEELDKQLYTNQKQFADEFKEYFNLIKLVNSVIQGKRNSLIIGGTPGTGKTYIVRRTLFLNGLRNEKDFVYLKGSGLDLEAIYEWMYKYRNKLLVFDDFDKLIENPEVIDLLKAATDSYPKRVLSLARSTKVTVGQQTTLNLAPEKFVFTGRVIIITNKLMSEIDPAIISRTGYVEISFSTEEMLKIIQKIMKYVYPDVPISVKQEVLDHMMLVRQKYRNADISIRTFKSCLDLRLAFPNNWKELSLNILKGK